MKKMLTAFVVAFLAQSSFAADKAKLDDLVQKLGFKLDAMMSKSDKRIPVDELKKARGIILLDRSKAGFLFSYSGGGGVAMLKDSKSQKWGPAAFMKANEASVGFQVGSQQSFVAILLMSTNAVDSLFNPKIDFAGEASGTAKDETKGTEAQITPEAGVRIYDDREGLYGGAAIKGGAIAVDEKANRAYYGEYLTIQNILVDKKVKSSPRVDELAKKLVDYTKK